MSARPIAAHNPTWRVDGLPKFTRTSVTLAMRDGSRPVMPGWRFESCGAALVAHKILASSGRTDCGWTLTELTRGLSVGIQADTRDAAVADWLARVDRLGIANVTEQLTRAIAAATPL